MFSFTRENTMTADEEASIKNLEEEKKIRLSVSKTKTYLSCAKSFNFNYIQKIPQKDQGHLTFGSFCHLALENFHIAYMEGSTLAHGKQMQISFKSALEDPEFAGKITPEMKTECKTIMGQYIQFLKGEMPNVLGVEDQFSQAVNDQRIIVTMNGLIDRIDLDKDGIYHVKDYKTNKDSKYLKDDWFQLLTYAFVLLQRYPEIQQVRGSYVMLRNNFEHITKTFDKEEILTTKQKYLDYGYKIATETEYKANPTILCGWCPYLELCKEGQQRVNASTQFNPIKGEIAW